MDVDPPDPDPTREDSTKMAGDESEYDTASDTELPPATLMRADTSASMGEQQPGSEAHDTGSADENGYDRVSGDDSHDDESSSTRYSRSTRQLLRAAEPGGSNTAALESTSMAPGGTGYTVADQDFLFGSVEPDEEALAAATADPGARQDASRRAQDALALFTSQQPLPFWAEGIEVHCFGKVSLSGFAVQQAEVWSPSGLLRSSAGGSARRPASPVTLCEILHPRISDPHSHTL